MMKKRNLFLLIFILIVALFLRLKLFSYKTHWSDMYFWQDWGKGMVNLGPSQFYNHFNADYLPFYPLVLGFVYRLYELTKNIFHHQLPIYYFYKLPATITDILLAIFLFKLIYKKSLVFAYLGLIFFLFNPAIFANSSLWGQVDVIGTFFVILSIYFFIKKHFLWLGASLAFALCTKPLYLLAVPVFTIGLLMVRKIEKKGIGWFFKNQAVFLLTCLFFIWLISYPFVDFSSHVFFDGLGKPLLFLFKRYQIITQRYPYTSVNAFNFWALVDKAFWLSDSRPFIRFSYYQWGNLINIILVMTILVRLVFINKNDWFYRLILSLALLFFTSFMFLTRIHERHLYYVLPFIILAASKNKRLLLAYLILSITYVFNLNFALEYYYQNMKYIYNWQLINFFSFINLIIFCWLVLEYFVFPLKINQNHE